VTRDKGQSAATLKWTGPKWFPFGTNPCRDAQRQQNPKLGPVPKPSRSFLMTAKKGLTAATC
jgi:hypothetical protein